jgi:hypothetical protein
MELIYERWEVVGSGSSMRLNNDGWFVMNDAVNSFIYDL